MIRARPIINREQWLDWRRENSNASDIAALFGDDVHPYRSALQLWAIRCDAVQEQQDNALLRKGRWLEPAILEAICDTHPDWKVHKTGVYFDEPEFRIGATPDFDCKRPDRAGRGIIQGKTVGGHVWHKWLDRDTGELEVPIWIAIQASVEAYLSGADWAMAAALVIGYGGADLHLFDVPLVPELVSKAKLLAAEFERRVREREPYPPDWGKDAALVLSLYDPEDDGVIDRSNDPAFGELLDLRETLLASERAANEAKKARKVVNAKLVYAMGNSARARFGRTVVTARTVKVPGKYVKAYAYPRLSVTGGPSRAVEDIEP